jgi:hypothetical protein
MDKISSTETQLIAPCGMNCGICLGYLREKRKCPGCHGDVTAPGCIKCIIRNCEVIAENQSKFCYECDEFPCKRLKQLDKRYRTRYAMSMIENLENIRRIGLDAFVDSEKKRWACPECGSVICVHRGYCMNCGRKRPEIK